MSNNLFIFLTSVLFSMKSKFKPCPNGCGKMHHGLTKIAETNIRKSLTIALQYGGL